MTQRNDTSRAAAARPRQTFTTSPRKPTAPRSDTEPNAAMEAGRARQRISPCCCSAYWQSRCSLALAQAGRPPTRADRGFDDQAAARHAHGHLAHRQRGARRRRRRCRDGRPRGPGVGAGGHLDSGAFGRGCTCADGLDRGVRDRGMRPYDPCRRGAGGGVGDVLVQGCSRERGAHRLRRGQTVVALRADAPAR